MRGSRFHGSTGAKNEREAKAVERVEKAKARKYVEDAGKAKTSLRLDDVNERFWQEVGQHHLGSDTTDRDLARLIEYFGPDKMLTDIHDDEVTKLVAWRRGHRVTRRKKVNGQWQQDLKAPLVAPATVNRSTTEVLKKLFTRAKAWGVQFDREPDWKKHWLNEPEEHHRELQQDELARFDATVREDYRDVLDFADASGVRLNECLLKWSEVNWDTKQIVKKGKGARTVTVRITRLIRSILWPLKGHHPESVFTYIAKRTRKDKGLVKGQRYPVTYNGLKTEWKRHRARAGVSNFRFHDKRHDFAMKLLRETKNLKLVQQALNHRNIKTTMRYATVLDDEVASGIEAMQEKREESRNLSRSASKKLA
ncbi:tyrosine-type recombinase/integrase [Bradyrhizobium elkanii]|uniref:tyrosine-type recombinase/integrase n=1 Tax=Bradyrhizobium elkanii TaxID=29448 RepID=UPI003516303B